MANVKNGDLREMVIDRCLQNRKGYSTKEIFEKCNHALERKGEYPVTSLNTIRNDILAISNRWHVNIEAIKDGRNMRYRYEDPNFSIFDNPLNDEEIAQLSQSVNLLRHFEGMPGFEWVDELNARIQTTIYTKIQPTVGFDNNSRLKGIEFFTPTFNAINEKRTLQIVYKTYSGKTFDTIVHPYFLKEYNQRWFLFGLNDEYKSITNFALDRIETIKNSAVQYIENATVNFQEFFNNIIGVSVNQEKGIEEIKLWVDKEQLPYTLSKPLHQSQTLIKTNDDGSAIISIKVRSNFELIQLLLSFGERVIILSPSALREEILSRLKKNIEKYQLVQID